MQKSLLLFLFLNLAACSTYQFRAQQARQELRSGNYLAAAEAIKEKALKEGDDQLVYLFDYALAMQYAGQYEKSNQAFQMADQISEVKDYHSITRITGSMLLNESLVQYKGEDFEKVLINAFGAINFLMLGNLESALVEARRLNEKLRLYKEEAKKDYEQNVFAIYLAAIAWEADQKFDDAYIDYEKAYKLNPGYKPLEKDLIRAAALAQRPEMVKKWRRQFPETAKALDEEWRDRSKGELVVIYQQGWGPRKRPHPAWPRIPKLYPQSSFTRRAQVKIEKLDLAPNETKSVEKISTQEIYNVTDVAVQTLDKAYAGLIAKRIASRVIKHRVASEIGKKNKGLGNLAYLVMSVADQADLRQWSTLPNGFQVARIYLPAGKYKVSIEGLTVSGTPSGESNTPQEIEISPLKKKFINWRSFN